MTENKNYRIKEGALIEKYQELVFSLYKNYPGVAKTKVSEFERTFSSINPFFKYGNAENYFLFDNGKIVGHITAISDDRFGNVGSIGFFECEDNQIYADMLFEKASEFLKKAGKKTCRGPINMTVWQSFRVSSPEDNPPFYLEPFTLSYYKDLFVRNNFITSHQNITTAEAIDKTVIKNYEDLYNQSIGNGYSYEIINKNNAKESVRDIYFLTCKIFEGSYSFYNISEEEFSFFAKQYTEIQGTHYIFVIKNPKKEPVGFFFAIPDLFNPHLKTVVLKTMGLLPEYRGQGLGSAMLYFVYKNTKKDGFKQLIFCTMSVDNERIKSLTGQNLLPYRKYEVFEKNII